VARAIECAQATTFDLLDLFARQCRHARRIIDRDTSLNTLLLQPRTINREIVRVIDTDIDRTLAPT
jgi:hypothetical protein